MFYKYLIGILISFLLINVSLYSNSLFSILEEDYKIKTIVIDPGHGGKDPGAVGSFTKEKDIVLSISLKLGRYIEKEFPHIKVIYTRKTDVFIPLDKRAEIANSNHADLFISIHINAAKSKSAYGFETFVMGLHKNASNLEIAKKENSVISLEKDYETKYNGFDPNSPESYIIFKLMQHEFLGQSLMFAEMIQDDIEKRALRCNRGVKQAGFLVLAKTTMPSILIEGGFLSNIEEQRYLNSTQGQDILASSIFRAFKKYKSKVENIRTPVEIIKTDRNFNKNLQKNTVYQVQIITSLKPLSLDDKKFRGYRSVYEYFINNKYIYTIGNEKEYNQIIKYRKRLDEIFKGCFVVAFENGVQITIEKAKKNT